MMIDVHSHIIPGIDDGAKNFAVAASMLKMAAADGITEIIATPHAIEGEWLPKWETIVGNCLKLCRISAENGSVIRIYPGAEVSLASEILNQITGPGPYCLNETSYILIELPALEIPSYADETFFKLQINGLVPMLAHPELNEELSRDFERLEDWVRKGILLQVNAASIEGGRGKRVMKFVKKLLLNDMVYCIGSDSHGTYSRPPGLTSAAGKTEKLIGFEKAQRLMKENPETILHNRKNDPQIEKSEIRPMSVMKKLWNFQF